MKKCLLFLSFISIISCSSDSSEPTENSSPRGKLKTIEINNLAADATFKTTYIYDSNGRFYSSTNESIDSNGTSSTYSTTHFYNEQGQIWKNTSETNITELYFSDGLITSSTRTFSGNTYNREYEYNSASQLIEVRYLDDTGNVVGEYNLTYNSSGNVENTIENISGTITEYIYEYDNNSNPLLTAFENQELSKLSEQNINNHTKRTWIRDVGTTIYTNEYTYNELGLPVTMNEYQNGTLVTQRTYSYYE